MDGTKWGNNTGSGRQRRGHWATEEGQVSVTTESLFGAGGTLCQISQGFLCNSNPSWLLVKVYNLFTEILPINTQSIRDEICQGLWRWKMTGFIQLSFLPPHFVPPRKLDSSKYHNSRSSHKTGSFKPKYKASHFMSISDYASKLNQTCPSVCTGSKRLWMLRKGVAELNTLCLDYIFDQKEHSRKYFFNGCPPCNCKTGL